MQRVRVFADSGPAAIIMKSAHEGSFDPFFYCTYHADLKGFSAREAYRHYRRHGWREARPPNPSTMLRLLEAQEGPLPEDFRTLDYLQLNQDLRQELRHDWQAAEHYLRRGRHDGRRYKTQPTGLTERSAVNHLQSRLVQAFGNALVDEGLVQHVHRAVASADGSATFAAPLMDPVLLGRWLLTAPDAAAVDFSDLRTQLTILFRVVFELHLITGRSALEMKVLNSLRRLAINTIVFQADGRRPSVTILMLAARAVSEESFYEAPTPEEAAGIVSRFFTRDVPRMELRRYVTPEQRARLRAPAAADDATPLAVSLLEEVEGVAALASVREPAELKARFVEEGVWLLGMDYVLSGHQLEVAQVQILADREWIKLSAPSFLIRPEQSADVNEPASFGVRQDWLRRFVLSEREDKGMPETLVSGSASAYVFAGLTPKPPSEVRSGRGGGRNPVRAGDLITFGLDGAGPQHLIGSGWHDVEVTHVWSADKHALLAINLDEEDVGPS